MSLAELNHLFWQKFGCNYDFYAIKGFHPRLGFLVTLKSRRTHVTFQDHSLISPDDAKTKAVQLAKREMSINRFIYLLCVLMDRYFYNPSSSGGYAGIGALSRASGASQKQATGYLRRQKVYQLHKPVVRKFKRRKYLVSGIDDLWQADLADMQKYRRQNGGVGYLLVVIDVFSKYLWVKPLKKKTATETASAVEDIIVEAGRKPRNFMTDKGTEFASTPEYFEKVGVNYYTSNNPETKASVAERVIRTLKGRIYKYMSANSTKKYIDKLNDIVGAYNDSKHRSIGMKPSQVTEETQDQVYDMLFPVIAQKPKPKFKSGDYVRVALTPSQFSKGYLPQWTEEIFTVARRMDTIPPTYKLRDDKNQLVTGTFYEPELQLIYPDTDTDESVEL